MIAKEDYPATKLTDKRRNELHSGEINGKVINFHVLAKLDRNFSPSDTAVLKEEIYQVIRDTLVLGHGYGPIYSKLCDVVNAAQVNGKSKL